MDKIRDPQFKTLVLDFHCIFTAYDQHRDLFQPSPVFHYIHDSKSVQLRHLKIQKERRCLILIHLQFPYCLIPVLCRFDNVFIFQHIAQQLAIYLHIIHYQYPLHNYPHFRVSFLHIFHSFLYSLIPYYQYTKNMIFAQVLFMVGSPLHY